MATLTWAQAQDNHFEPVNLEARFSLMGELTGDYLEAKINVIALPDETDYRALGLFWKAATEEEGEVFYSGGILQLDGYRMDYADGHILQSHVKLEHRDETRPPLYGALLGGSGRLSSDNVPEPVLADGAEFSFTLQFPENDLSAHQATILFSFIDEQNEAFIGAGLAQIEAGWEALEAIGTASKVSLQEGPSWNTHYASFEIHLADGQSISIPIALIMPELVFRSVTE
ncbi:MAG: hypothetical protein KC422_08410 [Trueperaceae bacterium]|nr:hypothetical protein [Trueperaceae bacterium]